MHFRLRLLGAFLLLLVVIVIMVSCTNDDSPNTRPMPTSRPHPTATPTPTFAPRPVATPTANELLREFVLCDRLKANLGLLWGQTPNAIYSGDPRISGRIVQGDYVQILMGNPTEDGYLRVQVYPHDRRVVGDDGQVWIDWRELIRFRADRLMFTCET